MERDQVLKVLVPVGGLAVLLLVVAAVIALSGGADTATTTPATKDGPAEAAIAARVAGDVVSATSAAGGGPKLDFPLDDPEWKDRGEGLKIWDVKEGGGAVCPTLAERPNLVVKIHYTGWLTSGMEFDSSRKPGTPPYESRLGPDPTGQGGLIDGWRRGLPGMKVGGKRRLLIPSHLGYGASGMPPQIPGSATLVFDIELLDVK